MTSAALPLPRPTPLSKPFWEGCSREQLLVQRCRACGLHVFIPAPCCTRCTSLYLEWVQSSGRGTVYSHSVVWRPQQPAFETPYIVAIVEMEEGWMALTNLVDCEPAAVSIGMPVEVTFRRVSESITLPYFRPRAAAAGAKP
jgi:hypothetical protein